METASTFEQELERVYREAAHTAARESWPRPHAPPIDPAAQPFVFQQIEVEQHQGSAPLRFSDGTPSSRPIMRLFGVTASQHSVLCNVHGFEPYFYVPCPDGATDADISALLSDLHAQAGNKGSFSTAFVERKSIYGYAGPANTRFLRILASSTYAFNEARSLFETGAIRSGRFGGRVFPTFESNIPLVLRFMVDTHITGMNWVEIPQGTYEVRSWNNQTSHCQYEIDVHVKDLISHAPEGDWSHIAPLRILSFDIECAGRKGAFPEASQDPVIQIASVLKVHGEKQPRARTVFSFRECAAIVGADVVSCETEDQLFMKWLEFYQTVDPDIVIGYNICNFDFAYLLDRAAALGLAKNFPFFGRMRNVSTRAQTAIFSSKAYGTRESKTFNLDGRIIFDMFQVMQRDYKLRSYSLNAVCANFLGEQKEDVPHSIITDLFDGNDETRRRLAVYCLKDAVLPLRLMDKLMCLFNYTEMARVTGIPFNYILSRGQQVKVISQLYRRAANDGFLVPAIKTEAGDEQYEGATVIEPIKGYYDLPIATLDFASLYPSIMMAHNLCYTTLLDKASIERFGLSESDYIKTPSGDYFVKAHVRKGILPVILEDLLAARKRAKADLKNETDPDRRAVLDGRQLALKISANSVYGFTGATVGKLPCIAISQSVTSFGREMIEFTKTLVEKRFCCANGYEHDAKVIYGDTDSVMIKFGPDSLERAMALGREASGFVSSHFSRPICLEFEKCYFPYLLINKKRYAGLYWTNCERYDKLDTKGIETVRRDNCRLVQTVIDTSLRKILIDRDVVGAKEYVKGIIADLLQNKVDLSQLVISKALSKSGEDYAGKQAHVELAEKMRVRDAATAPTLGDRVAYVIVRGAKGSAAYEKSEDPIYVLDNNLPIDTQYYLENQLSKPLMRIFEPILDNPNELLSGDHTRSVKVTAPMTGMMSRFAVKLETCIGCKATLQKDQILVCDHCKERSPELYLEHLEKMTELEDRYSRLWTQCQRCQGSIIQDVLCTSRDCPIFYMRKKTQKDMQIAAKQDIKFRSLAW